VAEEESRINRQREAIGMFSTQRGRAGYEAEPKTTDSLCELKERFLSVKSDLSRYRKQGYFFVGSSTIFSAKK
jgi:hypothetical protein